MLKPIFLLIALGIQAGAYAQKPPVQVYDATDSSLLVAPTILINGRMVNAASPLLLTGKKSQYRIQISALGYRNLDTVVTHKEAHAFYLRRNTLFLDALELKSVRVAERQPFTSTIIGKADLEKINLGADLPILLEQTPSVVANSNAGNGIGYTGLSIRGTDATRINVTLNGIPYNDAESQGSFFVNIPDLASSAGSIQIQRGAGPSTNGSAAFGATINVGTNEYNEKPYGEVALSAGSFQSFKTTVRAGSGLVNKHFTTDVRLSHIQSNGYIDRSASRLQSFYLSQAFINKKTQLRFNVLSGRERTQQAWNGIDEATLATNRRFNPLGTEKPGEPYEDQTDNYQQTHYQFFVNHSISTHLKFQLASFYTRGKGYYQEYRANAAYNDYGKNQPGNTDLIRQLWLDNHFYGQTSSLQYKKGKTELTVGGGWTSYDGKHYGKVIWADAGGFEPDYRWYDLTAFKKNSHVYAKYLQALKNGWNAYADVQYHNVQYTMNGFRNNPELRIHRRFNFVNPKAGISWQRKGWNSYASVAVASKEPNRDDFEAGTQVQPRPEFLYNLETGTTLQKPGYSLGINFYWMEYRNQLIVSGKINDVGAYTRVNVPESRRLGLEIQGQAKLQKQLQIQGNLTISRNKIATFTEYIDDYDAPSFQQKTIVHSNTDIALSPNVIAGVQLLYQVNEWLQLMLPGKYVGRQYLDNTQARNRSLSDYYVQDFAVVASPVVKGLGKLQLQARVYNALNKRYVATGYTFSYLSGGLQTQNFFFPMATRHYMVGMSMGF